MAKVIAFCNLHDGPHLGELTKARPLGSTTFLGRYGLMDFTLSNFSNSHIDRVYILVENDLHSIRSHVQNGNIWINNTKLGFQRLIFNEKRTGSPKYNTDINNILANASANDDIYYDYVVVAPAFFLMNIDFRQVIDAHIASKRDITIVYKHVRNADKEFLNCDKVAVDDKGDIKFDFETNSGKNKTADISLETFVLSKAMFKEIVDNAHNISSLYSLRNLIGYYAGRGLAKVGGYEFKDIVVPILTFQDYIEHSMEMLDYGVRKKLFKEDWPIYTTTHNTPPTMYGEKAEVKNSFIANGSIIKGKVENCIISRAVKVEEGSTLKNCIVFTKSEIGQNINMQYVLVDKFAKINQKKNVKGDKDNYLFVSTGEKI